MTAKEIAQKALMQAIDHDSRTDEDVDWLWDLEEDITMRIKAYARQKCKEQRDICAYVGWHLKYEAPEEELLEIADKLRNTCEPVME